MSDTKDTFHLRLTWMRDKDSGYICCWPDTAKGRKDCSRPVGYVALSRRPGRFGKETVYERNGMGLCDQHWGKRNAKRK